MAATIASSLSSATTTTSTKATAASSSSSSNSTLIGKSRTTHSSFDANNSTSRHSTFRAPPPSPSPPPHLVKFKIGQLVWTKLDNHPWWPCKVARENSIDINNSHVKLISKNSIFFYFKKASFIICSLKFNWESPKNF
jgi:hypothetical protein